MPICAITLRVHCHYKVLIPTVRGSTLIRQIPTSKVAPPPALKGLIPRFDLKTYYHISLSGPDEHNR